MLDYFTAADTLSFGVAPSSSYVEHWDDEDSWVDSDEEDQWSPEEVALLYYALLEGRPSAGSIIESDDGCKERSRVPDCVGDHLSQIPLDKIMLHSSNSSSMLQESLALNSQGLAAVTDSEKRTIPDKKKNANFKQHDKPDDQVLNQNAMNSNIDTLAKEKGVVPTFTKGTTNNEKALFIDHMKINIPQSQTPDPLDKREVFTIGLRSKKKKGIMDERRDVLYAQSRAQMRNEDPSQIQECFQAVQELTKQFQQMTKAQPDKAQPPQQGIPKGNQEPELIRPYCRFKARPARLLLDLEAIRIKVLTQDALEEFRLKIDHLPDYRILRSILDRDYVRVHHVYIEK